MQRTRGRVGRWLGIVAALGLAVGAAACGSDDEGGSESASPPATTQAADSKPAAAKPTGTPIKVMVVAAVDTPIQDYPDLWAAGKAAANAINNAGGINGQPVEILTCNDKSDPNAAGACARQAVQEKVAAVTGYTIGTATMLPILERSGIQYVGGFVSMPPDWTAPNSWPITGGSAVSLMAEPFALKAKGAKTMVAVGADLSAFAATIVSVTRGAEAAGVEVVDRPVRIPIDATDFAPYVQQLKDSGADSASISGSYQQILQLTKAAEQLGLEMTLANQASSLSPDLLKEMGPAADGVVATGTLPPVTSSLPAIKQFNEEMDAAGAAGIEATDNRRAATQETWLALHAIAALGDRVDGEVDAAALKKALETEKNVDIVGLIDWTPSTPGPADYPRVSNGIVYPQVVKDGVLVEDGQPFDVFEKMG